MKHPRLTIYVLAAAISIARFAFADDDDYEA